MNAACKSCKHSARCVPDPNEYIPILFQHIARPTPFVMGEDDRSLAQICDDHAKLLRASFMEALPDGCPQMTPARRKLTEVHWECVNDTLTMNLVWPRFTLGEMSMGRRRV
jgi:hypothetical protein